MLQNCTGKYYQAFYAMEDDGSLDVNNEVDMFCLHYVFLPVINHSLSCFRETWIHHRIRTEGNLTPEQLWRRGIIQGYPVDRVNEVTIKISDAFFMHLYALLVLKV